MMRDVTDRVVLVTGGSRGIGAAIVRALHAAQTSVYFTYARDRDAAQTLATACGGERARVAFERNDLAEPETFAGLLDRTLTRFGRIDALVNNAGIFAENPFDGDDFAAWRAGWRRTFEVIFSVLRISPGTPCARCALRRRTRAAFADASSTSSLAPHIAAN